MLIGRSPLCPENRARLDTRPGALPVSHLFARVLPALATISHGFGALCKRQGVFPETHPARAQPTPSIPDCPDSEERRILHAADQLFEVAGVRVVAIGHAQDDSQVAGASRSHAMPYPTSFEHD